MCSLGKTLLAFALLHFVLQGQTSCYARYLLTSYFRIPFFNLTPRENKDVKGENVSTFPNLSFWIVSLWDLITIVFFKKEKKLAFIEFLAQYR